MVSTGWNLGLDISIIYLGLKVSNLIFYIQVEENKNKLQGLFTKNGSSSVQESE